MSRFDIEKVGHSKNAFRRELAARPVAEKLRVLDELLRRSRVIKRATPIESENAAKKGRD